MPHIILIVLLLIFIICSTLSAVEQKDVSKPPSMPEYNLHLPQIKGKSPCVIICSGQGYHKDLPLIKEFALLAEKQGFAAVRFNWSYFTAKGSPSAEGSVELKDIESILKMVRQHPAIDTSRIYIAGKSMGSLLAYYAFMEHQELKGCLLLTPLLPDAEQGNAYYPELAKEKRPVAFILGDRDYQMCKLAELYKYLGTCPQHIPVVVLAGDHGIQLENKKNDDAITKLNLESIRLAAEAAVYRLKVFEMEN